MENELSIAILITGSLIVFIVVSFVNRAKHNKKLKEKIEEGWGKEPGEKYKNEELQSISSYYINLKGIKKESFFIDDITWNDLDMDNIFKRINNTQSTVGEEYLYALLREPLLDEKGLEERGRMIEYFQNNPAGRTEIQFHLAKLGKKRSIGISDYFYSSEKRSSLKGIFYRLLSLTSILSPVLMIFSFEAGLTLLIASFMVNMFVYYKAKNEIAAQLEALSYLVGLVNCAKKISDYGINGFDEHMKRLKESLIKVGKMNKRGFSLFYISGDPITEYLKIILLKELIDYESLCGSISKFRDELKRIYEIIGLFDALIAAASYRESVSHFVLPELKNISKDSKSELLNFNDAYHPLIKDPVLNSFDTEKSVLITGSNASGKSTFLKTVAINAVFAQTICTCLASKYTSCFFTVFSSMALKDNLLNNESYYIAEIKSLKRILDGMNNDAPCLCVIDEVLRGTNTVERISASSQVLYHLSSNNCLCFAATHDIELTHLLENHYVNCHFQEKISDNEVLFDYKIYEGRATSRNAIKLLKLLGYSDSIVKEAEERACSFVEEGKWNRVE
jgi:DNA mismatch repair ATPase MutS